MKYTFKATERLKSRKTIGNLFTEGKVIKAFPYKLVYAPLPDAKEGKIEFAVSVSKRLFKNATDRIRIKRLIREAYRLEKPDFYEKVDQRYALMLIYITKKPLDFETSQKAMKKILNKFTLEITNRDE